MDKKIMHLLCSNSYSGAENVVCQIIRMFKYEVDYEMVYCSPDGDIADTLWDKGINFCPLKAMSIPQVANAIAKEKPDIIHAHDMRASFIAALVCKNIPLVSHIHNNSFESRGLSFKSLLYFFAACKAGRIIWVSKAANEGYRFYKYFLGKSVVLYNTIDIDALKKQAYADEQSYNYDIVYLGRFTYPKNPERLIRILENVIAQRPETKAALIGTGELEEKVKALAAEKNLCGNIDFLGFRSNPYKILENSKLMLMSSRWEGMPMCVLEAMSLGVPIVSTPTDGLAEIIENGVDGYLGSSDKELGRLCLEILNNKALRETLSKAASQKMRTIMDTGSYKAALKSIYTF